MEFAKLSTGLSFLLCETDVQKFNMPINNAGEFFNMVLLEYHSLADMTII